MPKKRRIKVSSAKAKGRRLQDWVAEQISKLLDIPWGHDDNSLIEPRLMGQSGTDIILRGEALDKFPLAIECKSSEKWNIPKAIKQVRSNQDKHHVGWLVFLKRKEFKNPIVVMDAEYFFASIAKNIRK
jgi:hypothetical protein